MRQRHRDDQGQVRRLTANGENPTTTTTLAEAHTSAERFAAAADEAIDRALSGDSEAFLTASRQTSAQ